MDTLGFRSEFKAKLLLLLLAAGCAANGCTRSQARRERFETDMWNLRNGTSAERAKAAVHVGGYVPTSETIAALLIAMGDPNPEVRAAAANAFGKMSHYPQLRTITISSGRQRAGDAIVESLAKAIEDDDPTVRGQAAMSLSSYGSAAESVVNVLVDCLKGDTDERVRESAYLAIDAISPAVLRSEDPALQRALAEVRDKGK